MFLPYPYHPLVHPQQANHFPMVHLLPQTLQVLLQVPAQDLAPLLVPLTLPQALNPLPLVPNLLPLVPNPLSLVLNFPLALNILLKISLV